MAHLEINSIPVECSSSEFSFATGGEVLRSFNGRPRATDRYRAREYRFTTDAGGLVYADAERLRSIILGDGHSWSFATSEASSRGLLPFVNQGFQENGTGYWDGALVLPDSATAQWSLAGDASWGWFNGWTILHWRNEGAGYRHWIRTSTGGSWQDGVPATAPADLTLAGTLLTFSSASADRYISDLVVLPYAIDASWVEGLEAFASTYQWPDLPYVIATGPSVPTIGTIFTALGEVGNVRRVSGFDGGQHVSKDVFDFSLRGV